MALRTLIAVAAVLTFTTQVSAHLPAPMVPTALVEDVKSATADIEFMDYVGSGQVIKLEPGDVLVLSYLKSCEHETITGGTVMVGVERSEVQDGQVVRAKVSCDGGKIRLSSQQASKSAASAFRLQSADIEPTLYARSPMVQLPKVLTSDTRTLLIERVDHPGERHEIKIDATVTGGGFYDLAKVNLSLIRGATYSASLDGHKMTFAIDRKAKSGPAPVVTACCASNRTGCGPSDYGYGLCSETSRLERFKESGIRAGKLRAWMLASHGVSVGQGGMWNAG